MRIETNVSRAKFELIASEYFELKRNLNFTSQLASALDHYSWLLAVSPAVAVAFLFSTDLARARSITNPECLSAPQDIHKRACINISIAVGIYELVLAYMSGGKSLWATANLLLGVVWAVQISPLITAVVFIVTAAVTLLKAPPKLCWRLVYAFLPLVSTLVALSWSGYWASCYEGVSSHENSIQAQIYDALCYSFVPTSVVALYLMRGHRQLFLGLLLSEFWFSLALSSIGEMAVTQRWI